MEIKIENRFWIRFLVALACLLIVSSFVFAPLSQIIDGLMTIWRSPELALVDNMAVGGIGAALINSGLCTLVGVIFILLMDADLDGLVISACMSITGYALLGKNPFNILAPMMGVIAFSKFTKVPSKEYAPIALAASGLCPIVSFLFRYSGLPIPGYILGPTLGFLAGFILPPLSLDVISNHPGFFHYRNGLAVGIIGSIIASALLISGVDISAQDYFLDSTDTRLVYLIYGISIILLIPKIITLDFSDYKLLLKEVGGMPSSFATEFNHKTVMFNMGVMGILGTSYILAIGANLNGITLGGVITMMGFSTLMLHPRNALPILLGVFIAGKLGKFNVNSDTLAVAALFGTSLASIAGRYGTLKGIIAGMAHAALVSQSSSLHHGIILYNNSFSAGIVATLLLPFYEILDKRKNRP